MLYGKLFSSLYTGSMIGAGVVPFALMPYIIANAKPDKKLGGYVELNPRLLSAIFGGGISEKAIEEGIAFLCSPDPKSRTPGEQGRRLVKIGPFDYRVVNYPKYKAIRDEEDRREQNRLAQERFRAKQAQRKLRSHGKSAGEKMVEKEMDEEETARVEERRLAPHGPGDNPGSEQINWNEMP